MLATIKSASVIGVNAYLVDVEIDLGNGLLVFSTVGLPSNAVCESKTRVKSALENSGLGFPQKRVIVNLAPAHIKKEGTAFDLPIALGILLANGQIPEGCLNQTLVIGELSLDGKLRGVRGVLPLVIRAKSLGMKRVLLPQENAKEASVVEGIEIWIAEDLLEIFQVLKGDLKARHPDVDTEEMLSEAFEKGLSEQIDMADIKGQKQARRALEIAAAGAHHLLFLGSPGAGKTMLARRLSTIIPPLSFEERLESSMIASVAGVLKNDLPLITHRPFRSPHHSCSQVSMIGGGPNARPGEVSLAHHGVLFLDELPEFKRSALEALRQPLEDGEVVVARAQLTLKYPSRFSLIAAMNPCPCGYYGHPKQQCLCHSTAVRHYLQKVSGPLMDRIDLQVLVEPVDPNQLRDQSLGENSGEIRKRVIRARNLQKERFQNTTIFANAQMQASDLRRYCQLDQSAENMLRHAIEQLNLSARAHDRLLKVSRTIADLAEQKNIQVHHLAEAIQYRQLDRLWQM